MQRKFAVVSKWLRLTGVALALLLPVARATAEPLYHLEFQGSITAGGQTANVVGAFDWGFAAPLSVSNFDVRSTGALNTIFDDFLFFNPLAFEFAFSDGAGAALSVFFPNAFYAFPSGDVDLVLSGFPAVGSGTYTLQEVAVAVGEPSSVLLLIAGCIALLTLGRRTARAS